MIGQINFENNSLGVHIVNICSMPDVINIVEVGTWNGCGTTRCILEGIKEKHKYNVKSFECSPEMYIEAVKNNVKNIRSGFELILGKLVDEDCIDKWFDVSILNEEQKGWLLQDVNWMKNVPNVLFRVPELIDLLILDGGEYSTYPEWTLLKDRIHYCVLDDVNMIKCSKIRQEVLSSDKYQIIEENLNVGNGYLVFKKI